jgi:hypothetical protein
MPRYVVSHIDSDLEGRLSICFFLGYMVSVLYYAKSRMKGYAVWFGCQIIIITAYVGGE